MWTFEEAKPIAKELKARIVGSVRNKGKSQHDLDLLVPKYDDSIKHKMNEMGYEFVGSQTVSPDEIRKSRKFGGRSDFWLRNFRFTNTKINKVVEIWDVDSDTSPMPRNFR